VKLKEASGSKNRHDSDQRTFPKPWQHPPARSVREGAVQNSGSHRREEQKKRFLERLANRAKNWKFSSNDSRERGF